MQVIDIILTENEHEQIGIVDENKTLLIENTRVIRLRLTDARERAQRMSRVKSFNRWKIF